MLPSLALAQALGVLAADVASCDVAAAVAIVLAALSVLSSVSGPRAITGAALAMAFAAGALALALRLDEVERARPRAAREITFDADVARVDVRDGRARVELAPRDTDVEPRLPRRVLLLDDGVPPGEPSPPLRVAELVPGDLVRLRARLRAASALQNPGAAPSLRDLERRGIAAIARLGDPAWIVRIEEDGPALRRGLGAWRARRVLRIAAEGAGGGLLAALALGDRRGLSDADRLAFTTLGIVHLLSVSGLHLALAAAGAFALARRALARAWIARRGDVRRLALGVALASAALYATLCGLDVPVLRSLVFVAVTALAFVLRRPARNRDLVGCAALVVVTLDPAALFDLGAGLSFLASAALLAGARGTDARPGPLGAVREALGTSALATAATAPLLATQIGVAGGAGLVANAVAVPWTGLVLMPAAFLATALAGSEGETAAWLLRLAARIADVSLSAARAVAAQLPPVAPSPPPGGLAIALGVLLAVTTWRARRLRVRMALAALAVLAPGWLPPRALDPPAPRVVAIDVGQGTAAVVQGRRGAVLVDAGPAAPGRSDAGLAAVLPVLRALAIARLDLVVVSHADLDHRGGVASVLARVPVGALWLPCGARRDPAWDEIRALARQRGVPVVETGAGGAPAAHGELRVRPLWPRCEEGSGAGDAGSDNDRSLVIRVDVAGSAVLLPGDLEAEGERGLLARGIDLRANVLFLGHHGSRTSSSAALLDVVGADLVVASAPCESRFGMPHAAVVSRLRERGPALWWTGRDGAVLVGLGERLRAWGHGLAPTRCGRELARRPVAAPP